MIAHASPVSERRLNPPGSHRTRGRCSVHTLARTLSSAGEQRAARMQYLAAKGRPTDDDVDSDSPAGNATRALFCSSPGFRTSTN